MISFFNHKSTVDNILYMYCAIANPDCVKISTVDFFLINGCTILLCPLKLELTLEEPGEVR